MIVVLAGVNGAGKSSIGGEGLRSRGYDWYNPDSEARALEARFPSRPAEDINGEVWQEGFSRLQHAIIHDADFVIETTLGGSSITNALLDAVALGREVSIWYCGLTTVDLHIQRVADRVQRGGHNIPEDKIRARYHSSTGNLCRLVPGLSELSVFDNSEPLDDHGRPSGLRQLIAMRDKRIQVLDPDMPDWAKPIAAAVLIAAGAGT